MTDGEAGLIVALVLALVVAGIASTSLYAKGVSDGHAYEREAQEEALRNRATYVDALEKRLAVLTNPPTSATKSVVIVEEMPK